MLKLLPVTLAHASMSSLDIGDGGSYNDAEVRATILRRQAQILRKITAVDGSPAMIQLAQQAIDECGLSMTISVLQGYVPGLPLPVGHFDAVLSKDFLHHLPDPMSLWREIRRLIKPGGFICVMDLRRPDSSQAAHEIVEAVTADEAEVLRIDFYNSLLAAYTPEEIREQLKAAALNLDVTLSGDRHMLVTPVSSRGNETGAGFPARRSPSRR